MQVARAKFTQPLAVNLGAVALVTCKFIAGIQRVHSFHELVARGFCEYRCCTDRRYGPVAPDNCFAFDMAAVKAEIRQPITVDLDPLR